MSKKALTIRYAVGLLLMLVMGLGWLVIFAIKGDVAIGIRMFALATIVPGLFMTIWWLAELKEIDKRNK